MIDKKLALNFGNYLTDTEVNHHSVGAQLRTKKKDNHGREWIGQAERDVVKNKTESTQ